MFEHAFNASAKEPQFSRTLAEAIMAHAIGGTLSFFLYEDGRFTVRGRFPDHNHHSTTGRRIVLRVPLCDVPQAILLAGIDDLAKRNGGSGTGQPIIDFLQRIGFVQAAHAQLASEFFAELTVQQLRRDVAGGDHAATQ